MRLVKFLCKKLNLHADRNQALILVWVFVFGLINTYIGPTITKELVSNLPAEYIAFQALASSICGFIIGVLWQGGIREKAIKWFIPLALTESIVAFSLGVYLLFVDYNVWIFAIASLLYSCLVTIFISKCIMSFRSKLWEGHNEREAYDNNNSIVGGITCIVGFGLALLFLPSLKVALGLWSISCLFDNLAWCYVYYRNKTSLMEIV